MTTSCPGSISMTVIAPSITSNITVTGTCTTMSTCTPSTITCSGQGETSSTATTSIESGSACPLPTSLNWFETLFATYTGPTYASMSTPSVTSTTSSNIPSSSPNSDATTSSGP